MSYQDFIDQLGPATTLILVGVFLVPQAMQSAYHKHSNGISTESIIIGILGTGAGTLLGLSDPDLTPVAFQYVLLLFSLLVIAMYKFFPKN